MALRCVRVATFTLLLISFALLMGQPTAHAQTPTPEVPPTKKPTSTSRPTSTPICEIPKPGHGPLSLSSHAAPVADCVAKCRCNRGPETTLGDFLACLAGCTPPFNTRKPTATERPTRTPTATPPIPICCQCKSDVPSCFDTVLPEPCSPVGCVAIVG